MVGGIIIAQVNYINTIKRGVIILDNSTSLDYQQLAGQIKSWGLQLGFQQLGISHVDLSADETHLLNWLAGNMHGEMDYMSRHGTRRSRPAELRPGTIRVISVRMDYHPPDASHPIKVLKNPELAFVSRYAMGRDYHKVIRARLQKLATKIENLTGPFGYRAFVDSAPVLEKALARNGGLGWIGKHSNLINPRAGSWFFLGELYTDLPLPTDDGFTENHCGSCVACIDVCLENHRNAVQWTAWSCNLSLFVEDCSNGQRIRIQFNDRPQFGSVCVNTFDLGEVVANYVLCRQFTILHCGLQIRDRIFTKIN